MLGSDRSPAAFAATLTTSKHSELKTKKSRSYLGFLHRRSRSASPAVEIGQPILTSHKGCSSSSSDDSPAALAQAAIKRNKEVYAEHCATKPLPPLPVSDETCGYAPHYNQFPAPSQVHVHADTKMFPPTSFKRASDTLSSSPPSSAIGTPTSSLSRTSTWAASADSCTSASSNRKAVPDWYRSSVTYREHYKSMSAPPLTDRASSGSFTTVTPVCLTPTRQDVHQVLPESLPQLELATFSGLNAPKLNPPVARPLEMHSTDAAIPQRTGTKYSRPDPMLHIRTIPNLTEEDITRFHDLCHPVNDPWHGCKACRHRAKVLADRQAELDWRPAYDASYPKPGTKEWLAAAPRRRPRNLASECVGSLVRPSAGRP